jgi:arylsulfatase A-like enzyme
MRQQKALMPDRPFFLYFAPGATHAPHHVPKEWADRYAGEFDDGWDATRERPTGCPSLVAHRGASADRRAPGPVDGPGHRG